MLRIENFFKNHFDSVRISNARLRAFTDDHINKLIAKLSLGANAVLQQLLDDLLPVYNAYFGAINDEATRFALQQGRTVAVDNAWDNVLNFIRQKEGTVRGIWGKESPEYQEFYPLGLNEYNQATKLNKATLLSRYYDVANNYSPSLPPTFFPDFATLKGDWESRFAAQQQQIGLVKDAASARETSRTPLELQLMKNILTIAALYVGNEGMANDFFNQTLLEAPQYNLPKQGDIAPGELRVAATLDSYDPTFVWKLENLLGGPLEFGLSTDGVTITGNTTMLNTVGTTEFTMGDFGVEATILMVRNMGDTVSKWRVDEA
jgi:hypothetical protein